MLIETYKEVINLLKNSDEKHFREFVYLIAAQYPEILLKVSKIESLTDISLRFDIPTSFLVESPYKSKITAIEAIRGYTDLSLRDAKRVVENINESLSKSGKTLWE